MRGVPQIRNIMCTRDNCYRYLVWFAFRRPVYSMKTSSGTNGVARGLSLFNLLSLSHIISALIHVATDLGLLKPPQYGMPN